MRCLLATLLLALASCGAASHTDDVVVRRYEAANGDPAGSAEYLEFTYYTPEKGAKHGAAGFNILVWEGLTDDDDGDKIVRVVMHALLNVLVLSDGHAPDYAPGWYSFDSDTLDPFAPILPDEAEWIATHGTFNVRARDAWLVDPTREAVNRINEAAGVAVFLEE